MTTVRRPCLIFDDHEGKVGLTLYSGRKVGRSSFVIICAFSRPRATVHLSFCTVTALTGPAGLQDSQLLKLELLHKMLMAANIRTIDH